MKRFLSRAEIEALFAKMGADRTVEVIRIRYKNAQKIRRSNPMSVSELLSFLLACQEDSRQPGGDLEVQLEPNRILVGHHDGMYWLEDAEGNDIES